MTLEHHINRINVLDNSIGGRHLLPGEVDMALIDGFPQKSVDVVKLLQPRLRAGAVVIADNVGAFKGDYRDYVDFVRDPRNGFTSMLIPFKFGTEYSVRTPARADRAAA